MPYTIKKAKGQRPYQIVSQTGKVVGTSTSLAKAKRSIGYRMGAEPTPKSIKQFKRKVDNKMKGYGETDYAKQTVRINKSKKKNGKGEILDTIVHEGKHVMHPKMKEKTVQKETVKAIKHMGKKEKQKHYSLFK